MLNFFKKRKNSLQNEKLDGSNLSRVAREAEDDAKEFKRQFEKELKNNLNNFCERVGTGFVYELGGKSKKIDDLFLVGHADRETGYFLAVSQKTGKVGFGRSIEEAYKNLVIEISFAIDHMVRNLGEVQFVESQLKIWNDSNLVTRMDKSKVQKLIFEAKVMINKLAQELLGKNICKETEVAVKDRHDELEDTALGVSIKALDLVA